MRIDSGRLGGAPARRRLVARGLRLGVVALVLAATLTSFHSGAGSTPTASPVPSVTPSTTADPTTPTPTGAPSGGPSPSALAAGSVTIITLEVFDGLVQASGILPQVVEPDGVCTLTISRGEITRSDSVQATPGRESTYCGLVNVSVVGLDPGTWDAVLSYRSSATAGESAPTQVQVQ